MKRPGFAGEYGEAGTVRIGGCTIAWRALVHPGQRSPAWAALHDTWVEDRKSE